MKMLDRKYFERKLMKDENIDIIPNYDYKLLEKKHYSEEEVFDTLKIDKQKGLQMYKLNIKDTYEVWLLYGFIIGGDALNRKQRLLDKIKTFESNLNGKWSDGFDLVTMESLLELYNKYFAKEKECFTVKKDNKNVLVEWIVNRIMKLYTKDEGYSQYKTYTEIEDYYNLKLDGEYTENKFTIFDKKQFVQFDHNKNVILEFQKIDRLSIKTMFYFDFKNKLSEG